MLVKKANKKVGSYSSIKINGKSNFQMPCQQTGFNSNNQENNNQKLMKVNPDTLVAYQTYSEKLNILRKNLDSLGNIHEEITGKLEDLKYRSELIRKKQLQADLINGGIVVIIAVILIKIIHSKLKSKKK